MKILKEIAPLDVAQGLADGKLKPENILVDRGSQILPLRDTRLYFDDFAKFTYYLREVSK